MISLKNIFLYGGISKADYSELRSDICKSNIKNTIVFSALGVLAYIILYIGDSFSEILSTMKKIHGICLIACFIIFIFSIIYSKTKLKANFPTYIAIFSALSLGAIIGIFVNGNAQTTTFMVFLFAIPLIFTVRPVSSVIVIILADSIYIYLVLKMQSGAIRAHNLSNGLIFGTISIIFSSYMMNVKIKGFNNAKKYKFLMENDQLTGLNNRLSFNSYLEVIAKNRSKYTILEFDINGLKNANDIKGHIAGDEIIAGAADCIKNTFGKYGKCFRIGGDEFVAVLDKPYSSNELLKKFDETCSNWKGKLNDSLSISYGLVKLSEYQNETLEEILVIVDKLMYEKKSEYYIKTGINKRRS